MNLHLKNAYKKHLAQNCSKFVIQVQSAPPQTQDLICETPDLLKEGLKKHSLVVETQIINHVKDKTWAENLSEYLTVQTSLLLGGQGKRRRCNPKQLKKYGLMPFNKTEAS